MYTLYYSAGSCSRFCHVLLEEMKVPFDAKIVNTMGGQQNTPEYLKINPRAQVPVLQDGDFTLTEGVAIATYLLEKHPTPSMMPTDQPARALAMQWLSYFNSSLHPMFGAIFSATRTTSNEGAQKEIATGYSTRIAKAYAMMEDHLLKNKFFAGDQVSIADVLFTVISGWIGVTQPAVVPGPNCARVIAAVQALPSFQAVVARETAAKAELQKAA